MRLHGLLAWTWFTENDWQNFAAGLFTREEFKAYTSHNLPKIEAGVREVRAHATATAAGAAFLDGLCSWADDLDARCRAALGKDGGTA
jgi:hypothetical protein